MALTREVNKKVGKNLKVRHILGNTDCNTDPMLVWFPIVKIVHLINTPTRFSQLLKELIFILLFEIDNCHN